MPLPRTRRVQTRKQREESLATLLLKNSSNIVQCAEPGWNRLRRPFLFATFGDMTHIPDLAQCSYLPGSNAGLLALGWLSRDAVYPQGTVSEEFFQKCSELVRSPWQPFVSAGLHECDLCEFNGPLFSANLFVPFNIYVAPVAIVHYISGHWYVPPAAFIDAVLACPPMLSMEYKRAFVSKRR